MGKEFKILYWNINYKEGTAGKNRDNYKLASKICVDILKKYIDKENISAIVLTECYPQVNPDMKSYIYDYYRKNGSWKPNYARDSIAIPKDKHRTGNPVGIFSNPLRRNSFARTCHSIRQ